jgi:NAD(P)-dependent dehydrogenase (short-subunit alcohol dehydrogenase family)
VALAFAADGCIVFGTASNAQEVQDLKVTSCGRVSLAVCDITNHDSVNAWAGGVSDALGAAGLDILISTSGMVTPGPIELLSPDRIRHNFEVNVFGPLSVINAFLPAIRKARGRIVQVSTWEPVLPLAFSGTTIAAASALEAFAAAYRAELESFGIDVVLASSGNIRTGEHAKAAAAAARTGSSMTARGRDLYGRSFDAFARRLNEGQSPGMDVAAAAAQLMDIAIKKPAKSRGAIGPYAVEMLAAVLGPGNADPNAFRSAPSGLD